MNKFASKLIIFFMLLGMLFYFMPLHNNVSANNQSTPLFANGDLLWAKSMGGTYYEQGNSITTDTNGYIYISGVFTGTSDFDPGVGTANLTSNGDNSSPFTATFDIFVSKLEADGDFVWAKQMGGTNHDTSNSIITDGNGYIYTTGYFNETADFDPGTGVNQKTSSGERDIFVVKLDTDGNLAWVRSFGSTSYDEGMDIAIDDNNNIYIIGRFTGTVDFDPSVNVFNLTSTGSTVDIFILKLNSDGNFIWGKNLGGTGNDYGNAIAVDSNGSAIATGKFQNTVDFDPGPSTTNLTSAGNDEIFILKLNANGDFVFAKKMGGSGTEESRDIAIDSTDSILTTGFIYTGISDFDPGPNIYNLTSNNASLDIFISKLDSNGNFVWAKNIGGDNYDEGYSITVDIQDSVYTTGYFQQGFSQNTIDFDPGIEIYNLSYSGCSDAFISKLDSNGDFVFAKKMSGTGCELSRSIALDTSGNIYTTGFYSGTTDFDSSDANQFITSQDSSTDIFTTKFQKHIIGPPIISSIVCASASPTNAPVVDFTVDFSEAVQNVDIGDFIITTNGITGPFITNVTGSGSTYTVSVNTGSGSGTLRLDIPASASITDINNNSLGNLPFEASETYSILPAKPVTAPKLSLPKQNSISNNPMTSFFWNDVSYATIYEITIASNAAFSQGVFTVNTNSPTYTLTTPLTDGKYFWHVRALNRDGQSGKYSSTQVFIIDATPPLSPVPTSPIDSAALRSSPIFRWNKSTSAILYEFQYDNDVDFSSPAYTVTTKNNNIKPPAIPNGAFFWRVRAQDNAGNWSNWSSVRFVTINR